MFLSNFTLPTIIFTLSSILNIIELPHIRCCLINSMSCKVDTCKQVWVQKNVFGDIFLHQVIMPIQQYIRDVITERVNIT